jgi:hypothetical protein
VKDARVENDNLRVIEYPYEARKLRCGSVEHDRSGIRRSRFRFVFIAWGIEHCLEENGFSFEEVTVDSKEDVLDLYKG